MSIPSSADVLVVGAGTAGAGAAAFLAERGLRVVCVDRAPLSRAGARWVNGVPRWMFAQAGLAEPSGDELRSSPVPLHLMAGWGPAKIVVDGHDLLEVDMRHLVARLHALARDRGATLLARVSYS